MSPTQPFRADAAIPNRAGVGYKTRHTEAILADPGAIGFLEIHAENFMGDGGPAHAMLRAVRDVLPVSLHGIGLSIGADAPLDRDHLARLCRVADLCAPGLVSEHLAWSSHGGAYYNDLLPRPYTHETLSRVIDHVNTVQDALGRAMLLENPSSYIAFDASTMDEVTFISRVVAGTGCGLILDVNNVFVSATNLQSTAGDYIADFPLEAVGEIHLAGHAEEVDARGSPLLIDAHDRPVANPVLALYGDVLKRRGEPLPTLIEWDNDVPDFETLKGEAARADAVMAATLGCHA